MPEFVPKFSKILFIPAGKWWRRRQEELELEQQQFQRLQQRGHGRQHDLLDEARVQLQQQFQLEQQEQRGRLVEQGELRGERPNGKTVLSDG